MIRALYPEHVENSYNAMLETTQFLKNEQEIQIDINKFTDLWLNGRNGHKRSFRGDGNVLQLDRGSDYTTL